MSRILKVDNCLDCTHVKRTSSPTTGDSFDQFDEDVICTHPKARQTYNRNGIKGNSIVVSERWGLRKQCVIPKWCPLPKDK